MKNFIFRFFFKKKKLNDQFFGELNYSRSRKEWIGKNAESLPGESRGNVCLPDDGNADNFEWAYDKLSKIKSHWLEIRESVIDKIYDSSIKHETDPTVRYNFPDKERFKELICVDCVRIFNSAKNQEAPDYEVDFWSQRCGPYGGILRVNITDWQLGDVALLPEANPYPSKNKG